MIPTSKASPATVRRTVFGIACLCVLGLAAFLGTGAPSAPAAESFPGQGFLPDGRAYEMVSPPDKEGGEVIGNATRSQAAAAGSAFKFLSLQAFGDAVGTSNSTEYIAERSTDPDPGTNGWSTHAITPKQESQNPISAAIFLEPSYQGALSDDLELGIFKSWSPVPGAAEADVDTEAVSNLYRSENLLAPAAAGYRLASPCEAICAEPIPSLSKYTGGLPFYAGASADFDHVLFESGLNLATGASGSAANHKAYEWDDGALRLAGVLPGGNGAVRSVPGQGSGVQNNARIALHPISTDGSRIAFTSPIGGTGSQQGPIYSRINGKTTIQLNASERAVPDTPKPATYWDASTDHFRVFFTSNESLTEDAPINNSAKLYMWKKAEANEQQSLKVDAGGGSFKLILATQPATFTGTLATSGSNVKKATSVSVTSGALSVGQTVSGTGISPGTTITAMGDFSSTAQSQLTLSANSTSSGSKSLTAILNATTAALPFDATAQQVQEALEALKPIGPSNVSVTGGPGSPGGSTPYAITFTGDLAGVNMPQLSADSTSLSGGAATASVTTTQTVKNLSYLNVDGEPADASNGVWGVIGVSDDGRYVYFVATGQLVAGKPAPIDRALYLWHEGTISFIGEAFAVDESEMFTGENLSLSRLQPRVTPDGRHLFFNSRFGEGLLSSHSGTDYIHNGFRELYAYSADTDELQCASCNPSGAPATVNAVARERFNAGSSLTGTYISRVISDDGRYAFFTTAEALVSGDINGKRDAYLYDTQAGKPHLLSSGESPGDSFFLDASADGKDAFFVTQEQLSGWDNDAAYDLYDARVGGGFPEPPTPPPSCQGDACQPAPPTLNDPTPASSSFNGSGNEQGRKPKPSCPRGKRKVKARNGKTRCVKRQTSNRARDAKNERRAGR